MAFSNKWLWHEKFNNAIVKYALDRKGASVMQNPNPLNLTFCDVKKFDMQNPIIDKIATQVKACKKNFNARSNFWYWK